jgi:hypothetical protein
MGDAQLCRVSEDVGKLGAVLAVVATVTSIDFGAQDRDVPGAATEV